MRLFLALTALVFAALGFSQPTSFPVFSFEYQVGRASAIYVARITDVASDGGHLLCTLDVSETIKGSPVRQIRIPVWRPLEELMDWKRREIPLIILQNPEVNGQVHVYEVGNAELRLPKADFTFVHGGNKALEYIRILVKDQPSPSKDQYFVRPLPKGKVGEEWVRTLDQAGYTFGSISGLAVPVDEKLERWAIDQLGSRDPQDVQQGIYALGDFKSARNIELLKPFLRSDHWIAHTLAADNLGVEERYFPLREAAFTILRSWQVDVAPVQTEEKVANFEAVKEVRWHYELTRENLERLTRFPNLERLSFYGGELGFGDLNTIAQVKSIRILTLDHVKFRNEDLGVLAKLPLLVALNLNQTTLQDSGLEELAKIESLREIQVVDTEITEKGLDKLAKARPNIRVVGGESPAALFRYVRLPDMEGVRRVLDRTPSYLNRADNEQNTLLHFAVGSRSTEMVQFLLDLGVETDMVNRFGDTPFSIAASQHNPDFENIELLLARGANPNPKRDEKGNSLLHRAITYGPRWLIKRLLAAGADPTVKNNDDKTPDQMPAPEENARLVAEARKAWLNPPTMIPLAKAECPRVAYRLSPGSLENLATEAIGPFHAPLAWSKTPTQRDFLGPFGQQKVSIVLNSLPEHQHVTVEVDLFIIESWDGNGDGEGPDILDISVPGRGTLLHSTFFTNDEGPRKGLRFQSFPDVYTKGWHEAYTGAAESRSLGFGGEGGRSAVYRLTYTFAHAGRNLQLDLSGLTVPQGGVESLYGDERWGIGNLVIKTD